MKRVLLKILKLLMPPPPPPPRDPLFFQVVKESKDKQFVRFENSPGFDPN